MEEAMNGPNREAWQEAISQELHAMEANNVWQIVHIWVIKVVL